MKVWQAASLQAFFYIVLGAGPLAASLSADVIGIGDDVGFGRQQTMGTIAGAVIAAVGLFFVLRAK
ncbi:MAG TPA: hypothetical protein VLA37_11840 [Sphingomonadaceae bacterium]|nr:hypothetical protein [Sphingomonadaceae bacterium]